MMNNLTIIPEGEVKPDLKKLSLEELRKLKEKILDNVCQNVSSGKPNSNNHGFKTIKRKNKNRPSEISSKIDPSLNPYKNVIKTQIKPTVEKTKKIDPRFDSLYGEFDKRVFERNYKFLNDIKEKEKKKLKKKLKQNGPDDKKKTVKLLLQRMENQEREKQKMNVKDRIKLVQKQKVSEALKEGKKPQFLKKRESKILQLVGQYEELKSQGKINKHIKQKRIRSIGNEKKTNFFYDESIQ
ncbi:rRNA biogenesis protein RRP36 [Cinara cedri]|uniref:rRNA biogenesis protein RRP36 n=1 Tax=Cinara cedri TaxID=506608 RepID=A0A5E4MQH4_9HEMI|nr:rRNA biogenesis protein RRP36 [Cinara cedri]